MRRFFQIHLSTAIVMMLLASVFLGANLTERTIHRNGLIFFCKGWPYIYTMTSSFDSRAEMQRMLELTRKEASASDKTPSAEFERDIELTIERGLRYEDAAQELFGINKESSLTEREKVPTWNILRNIVVALGIMLCIGIAMEIYSRHQES